MIFFKKKIIFVHIPRTGGTSIEKNLWRNEFNEDFTFEMNDEKHLLQGFVDKYRNKYQSDGLQHLTLDNIKKIYPNEVKNFFTFCFIRNPYSRIASAYCEVMKYRKDLRDFLVLYKDSSFKHFIRLIKKNPHTHWMPMHNFFLTEDMNFIGKFENFSEDLVKLEKLSNIEFLKKNFSDSGNFSSNAHYLDFYNDKENIELVSEMYKEDLKLFKYNFDDFIKFENKNVKQKPLNPNIQLSDNERKITKFFKRYIKKKIYLLNKNGQF